MTDTQSVFLLFILIGFTAQLIDGALGMAYGVASTTLLMALGMPPALASANVHTAEIFTTAASGASHAWRRNIDWPVMWRLSIAGSLGAVIGATLLSNADTSAARPIIAAYLFVMGVIVISKAFKRHAPGAPVRKVVLLGAVGGFADTIGGGGWGPVVASNMLARGGDPARTIGTVNCAEFFMTLAASATFLVALGPSFGIAALGLITGGVAAAPIAAYLAGRLPRRTLLAAVGLLICMLSAYNLYKALAA